MNIGGEFEIRKKDYSKNFHPIGKTLSNLDNNFTINGISSFNQILISLKKKINKIYIPAFICESLLLPIKKNKIQYEFYKIDKNFSSKFIPKKNSAILIIHYFGIQNPLLNYLLKKNKNNFHIIEDCSHLYLNDNFKFEKKKNLFFFSLRKHGSIGAGGWSNIDYNLNKKITYKKDLLKNLSIRKQKQILIEKKSYQKNEIYFLNEFKKIKIFYEKKISYNKIENNFLKMNFSYKWTDIIKKRIRNWEILDKYIKKKFNKVVKKVNINQVPLGYIILTKKRDKLLKYLKSKRIFCSIHWPLSKEVNLKKFKYEKKLADEILTIPIDQRYGYRDMEYIGNILKSINIKQL